MYQGYRSWQANSAELINELELHRAPLENYLRIIRTFAKFTSPSISDSTCQKLTRVMLEAQNDSQTFYNRSK